MSPEMLLFSLGSLMAGIYFLGEALKVLGLLLRSSEPSFVAGLQKSALQGALLCFAAAAVKHYISS